MNRSRALLNLGLAAFAAAILAGPGAAVFPRTLRWGAWAACTAGSVPAPERYVAPFDRPGESQVRLLCLSPGGEARDRTLAAIGGLWVMYTMAGAVLLTLLSLRGSRPAAPASSSPPVPLAVPPAVEAEARALHASGQTISAIRVVRQATGMGLKQAKDWVEGLSSRPPAAAAAPAAAVTADSPSDRLAELKRMLEAGLITPAEFEAKKAEILSRL